MEHGTSTIVGSRPFEVTNRLVLAIAIPMTLAYLTTPLLGLVGTAVVGQFGDAALLGGLAAGAGDLPQIGHASANQRGVMQRGYCL